MVNKKQSKHRPLPRGLEILYEDSDLLVVNKPAGLLTVKTATEKTRTVYRILTDYVRKGSLKSRRQIYTVHRLDRWTSGVLIFAKSEAVMDRLEPLTKRYYDEFHQCPACEQIYWKGSHYERMQIIVNRLQRDHHS